MKSIQISDRGRIVDFNPRAAMIRACGREDCHQSGTGFVVDGQECCVVCAYHALIENLMESGHASTMQHAVQWLDMFNNGRIFPGGIHADDAPAMMRRLLESLNISHPALTGEDSKQTSIL